MANGEPKKKRWELMILNVGKLCLNFSPKEIRFFHINQFPLGNQWYYHLKWPNLNKWGAIQQTFNPIFQMAAPEGLSLFEFFTQFIPTLSGAFSDSSHACIQGKNALKFPVPTTSVPKVPNSLNAYNVICKGDDN